jgi:HlyD family secretion protein
MQKYRMMSGVGVVGILLLLFSWNSAPMAKAHNRHFYVVSEQSTSHTAYYSGKIEPVVLTAITTPKVGRIKKVCVSYGDLVEADAVLFTVESDASKDQSADTLVNYLKQRDQRALAEAHYQSYKKLWDAGVIPRNDYLKAKRERDLELVDLVKTKTRVMDILQVIGMDIHTLDNIALDDGEAIAGLINMHNQIPIRAPESGVFLMSPVKDAVSVEAGMHIEPKTTGGIIADPHALLIRIAVPERDINKIAVGQAVEVTGDGFPGVTLSGAVSVVNRYKYDHDNGNEVLFPVEVQITQQSADAEALVHVGMRAQVAIKQEYAARYFIPLAAVHMQRGQAIVAVKNHDGVVINKRVILGHTTSDQVEVIAGVQAGDQVVLDD